MEHAGESTTSEIMSAADIPDSNATNVEESVISCEPVKIEKEPIDDVECFKNPIELNQLQCEQPKHNDNQQTDEAPTSQECTDQSNPSETANDTQINEAPAEQPSEIGTSVSDGANDVSEGGIKSAEIPPPSIVEEANQPVEEENVIQVTDDKVDNNDVVEIKDDDDNYTSTPRISNEGSESINTVDSVNCTNDSQLESTMIGELEPKLEDDSAGEEYTITVSEDTNDVNAKKAVQTIEITELTSETDTTDNQDESMEYTVIESQGDESLSEDQIDDQNHESSGETLLLIGYDANESSSADEGATVVTVEKISDIDKNAQSNEYVEQVYIIGEEHESADDVDEPMYEEKQPTKADKPKKQRGRKPIGEIPLHVLGRDISKPSDGVSNGGRIMPKPRLGVKVPYRNLTSQIVSKEEIQKEIMDRFKQKQEQNPPADILFARKLTQRLARKLTASENKDARIIDQPDSPTTSTVKNTEQDDAVRIKDNSDLIAILEGDGEDIANIGKEKGLYDNKGKEGKQTEKEIALKQLKELPITKNRIFKSRSTITSEVRTTKTDDQTKVNIVKPLNKSKTDIITIQKQIKTDSPTRSVVERKSHIDVVPQLKPDMVIKTYARKRRSVEMESPVQVKRSLITSPELKIITGPSSADVYVTKSSRVIKRKVIWDPDEVSPKSSQIKSPVKQLVESPVKQNNGKNLDVETIEKKVLTPKSSSENKAPVHIKKILSKGALIKRPKRHTELDRLLMDEGAVNMLYDVNNTEDANQDKLKKKNKSIISLDKAHKELISKTNVIKNDLQQITNKHSPKSLRKKEVVTPTTSPKKPSSPLGGKKEPAGGGTVVPSAVARKKSKDSARSSVHSPPASPGFTYSGADASRIIRRHSSSSFSSGDEIEVENEESSTSDKPSRRKSATTSSSLDTVSRKKMKKNATPSTEKIKTEQQIPKNNNNTVNDNDSGNNKEADTRFKQYQTFKVTRTEKLVSIEINNKEDYYLSDLALKELICCLNELGTDNDCHVVAITSNGNNLFCRGVNYKDLVSDDADERKKKATAICSHIKDFLKCLLKFPKILVAGIQGICTGLGVTMLSLFDMVIASDVSTFNTPYTSLGCMGEAGFLLTIPYLNNYGLASELMFTTNVLKADDVFRRGLITKVCWNKHIYQEELNSVLLKMAAGSKQTIEANKKQLRKHYIKCTEELINSELDVIIDHWISSECQKNFSNYNIEN